MTDTEHTLLPYLIEGRKRLIYLLSIWCGLLLVLLPFATTLYQFFVLPILLVLPKHTLIATTLTGPLLAPLQVVCFFACLIILPFVLYQGFAFINPALSATERGVLQPLSIISTVCFYIGVTFGYFVMLPLFLRLLLFATPDHMWVLPDVSRYLGFAWRWLLAFGLAFEIPLVLVLLTRTQILSLQTLRNDRPYWIIGAFVLGMLIAPDVLGQLLFALPLCALFEVGLLLAHYYPPRPLPCKVE